MGRYSCECDQNIGKEEKKKEKEKEEKKEKKKKEEKEKEKEKKNEEKEKEKGPYHIFAMLWISNDDELDYEPL